MYHPCRTSSTICYLSWRLGASLREVEVISVGAYGAARANIRSVYRHLASYDICSRVGLRAVLGRVLEVNFETSLSVESTKG
jgi:hypothetical protein